jgi:hypothetical protein
MTSIYKSQAKDVYRRLRVYAWLQDGEISKHREEKDVRIAARYIVAPDSAKDFIEVFEKQKESAMDQDGTVDYRLFKTLVSRRTIRTL